VVFRKFGVGRDVLILHDGYTNAKSSGATTMSTSIDARIAVSPYSARERALPFSGRDRIPASSEGRQREKLECGAALARIDRQGLDPSGDGCGDDRGQRQQTVFDQGGDLEMLKEDQQSVAVRALYQRHRLVFSSRSPLVSAAQQHREALFRRLRTVHGSCRHPRYSEFGEHHEGAEAWGSKNTRFLRLPARMNNWRYVRSPSPLEDGTADRIKRLPSVINVFCDSLE